MNFDGRAGYQRISNTGKKSDGLVCLVQPLHRLWRALSPELYSSACAVWAWHCTSSVALASEVTYKIRASVHIEFKASPKQTHRHHGPKKWANSKNMPGWQLLLVKERTVSLKICFSSPSRVALFSFLLPSFFAFHPSANGNTVVLSFLLVRQLTKDLTFMLGTNLCVMSKGNSILDLCFDSIYDLQERYRPRTSEQRLYWPRAG